jgi:1-acylglycerone phosphate reductase
LAILQAFAPLLIRAKGCVVNNSSVNAVSPIGLLSALFNYPSFNGQLLSHLGVYNASKAALFTASETWRRELQPLGVRTITLATCAVKTRAFDEYRALELPETSQYHATRGLIQNIAEGHMQDGAISAKQFATKVVREVEKGTVGTVWAGTHAFLVRLTLWLSPQSALVSSRL